MKWIGMLLSKSNARLYSFNNMEIAGLRGQFTATIKYNGHQVKNTIDCHKSTTCMCSCKDPQRSPSLTC
uniref:Uncharacterized protein n=1 Tax=Romanomermis culicivorax TaxID=13658 RepID=A0A915JBK2_ROMCU